MANIPPPIQEPTTKGGNVFTRLWVRWLNSIDSRLQELEGAVASLTSFGETVTAQNTPIIEGNAVYGLVPANFREFTNASGTTGVEGRLFKTTTGATVGGFGAIQSFRFVKAKAGQSAMARYSGYFENGGVADSQQGIGLISIGDEFSFGYNGETFGIWHRYNGLAEVRTIEVTGASGGSTNLTLTLNGVTYTIPLTAGTVQHNAYEIADWLNTNQTVWAADQLDDIVIINALSDGAKSGSYSFSHATATGTITLNTAGVTKTSDFIAQTSWNANKLTALDPTKGNVYQITYQNMGFGETLFYIEDPVTADFINVHTIRSVNTTTTRSLGNPALRCGMYCASFGSTTDIAVYADAFSAFVQGTVQKTSNPRSFSNTQTLSTTNFTNVLTLRNRRTYNSYANQVEIEPLRLTVASEINKNVIVRIISLSDTGTEQNFQSTGANLVSDVDITATTGITGGTLLDSFTIEPTGSGQSNLKELGIRVPPDLNLCILAQRTGGASGEVSATLTWYEDI